MGMIEVNKNPSRKDLLVFSVLLGVALAIFKLWMIAAIVAVVAVALSAILPGVMRYVYLGAIYVTLPIGWVVSHVIMAVVYFLVVTPIGWIMKLCGYDPMHRRIDPAATTYWTEHDPAGEPGRYFRQF